MDTEFMNFNNEEYFSTSFLDSGAEDSHSCDESNNFPSWEWEQEKEINGDMAVIPVSGQFDSDISKFSSSPPTKDFHKLFYDWQQFINVDAPVTMDTFMCNDDGPKYDPTLEGEVPDDKFDISAYVTGVPVLSDSKPEVQPLSNFSSVVSERKCGIGGKKIDMKAQKYVIDEPEDDHIDVETVESGSLPVLEAGDVNSLLEQFEASEEFIHGPAKVQIENLDSIRVKTEPITIKEESNYSQEFEEVTQVKTELLYQKNQTIPEPVLSDSFKSKQILEALPPELITRIKESGKRKPISVIPPIPNKRRCGLKTQEAVTPVTRNKLLKLANSETVHLDHDYCSPLSPYPKNPKKDSGFESAEEDERTLLKNQPTVKNADGTLMVSLLKANTVKPATNENEVRQKRKLNLAEYKKRRDIVVKTEKSPQNKSFGATSSNSSVVEDEVTRRKKHEEKLLQMSIALLNTTPAKSNKTEIQIKTETPKKTETQKKPAATEQPDMTSSAPAVTPVTSTVVPEDMEVKTYLSVATNTETIPALPLCPEPVVEQIKPLLQHAKISTNSLIASVIENIPKVKNKNLLEEKSKSLESKSVCEHGENKTIVYLPKSRSRPQMRTVYVQTEGSPVDERRRHRSRRSTSSSSSESKNLEKKSRHRRKDRSNSGSSRYSSSGSSVSSSSRSSSRSRSRSRSSSPWESRKKYKMDYKRLQEVEERRVIYVGRISSTTTRDDLRRRFQSFGPITSVSVHFREHGDNYGFVTFLNKLDAYEAIEHGNDDPFYPKYDLSFGGRREFCKTSYSDLDNMREEAGYYYYPRKEEYTFDTLLRKAQEKLRKRKF